MVNNKLLKRLIISLCLAIFILIFALSAYNAGRVCLQSETVHGDIL